MIASLVSAAASKPIAAAVLRGRAIGAMVTAGFGALWIISGTHFLKRLQRRAWLSIALFTVVLCGTAARQIRRSSPPAVPSASSSSTGLTPRMSRQFGLILALEWIPILAVAVVLRRRQPDLILPAIALIVGLHFIPLGRIFGAPLYYFTGIAMVLATLAAFAVRTPSLRLAAVCMSCGFVLWLTSVILLI